jgi:RimJ/RimL family protein N-acetyltransferase
MCLPELLFTDRLLLRPLLSTDATMVFALNSDPEVMRYLPKDEVYTSIEEAGKFLEAYIEKSSTWDFSRWAVVRKSDQVVLGWCGLREVDDGEVDLGFRFLREHWGRGYATESGQRWLEYGFGSGGLSKIVAKAADENIGSQRVLTRLNFERRPKQDGEEDGFLWRSFMLRKP